MNPLLPLRIARMTRAAGRQVELTAASPPDAFA
jgi:hypothetical protein